MNHRIDTGIATVREVLDVLKGHSVEDIVMSPGSRNTPLTVGINARKEFRYHVVNDERTAAFAALGISIASRKPVVLVCTSGTAMYNYAPAVAEAFYSHIPLIVITADRTSESIGQEPQTLRQPGALREIVKQSYDIPHYERSESAKAEEYANRIANEAVNTACEKIQGPVHINIHFGEGFNLTLPYSDREDVRIVRNIENPSSLPPHIMRELAEEIINKKVMLIVGPNFTDHKLNRAITLFSKTGNVAAAYDVTSNVHLEGYGQFSAQWMANHLEDEDPEGRPDLIISLGGIPVSENLKTYIRRCPGLKHWTLGDTPLSVDVYGKLSRHFDVEPAPFLNSLTHFIKNFVKKGHALLYPDFGRLWAGRCNEIYEENVRKFRDAEMSEEAAMYQVFETLTGNLNVFLSNGLTVRNANKLMSRLPHNCWANRGVSGIEGTNATALGISYTSKIRTILVTGDMSFSYNPEILHLAEDADKLGIVVINNGGGGIFRKIKTTRDLPMIEECFCNAPNLPLKELCDAYGWDYVVAENLDEIKDAVRQLILPKRILVEIKL